MARPNKHAACFFCACLCLGFAAVDAAQGHTDSLYNHKSGYINYPAPNQSLRAEVVDTPPHFYYEAESVVIIRKTSGRRIAWRSYAAGAHEEQGHTVLEAKWTSNSEFFVYSLESSGGHSPTHSPIHFYDVRRGRFYGLDDFIIPAYIASPNFRFKSAATVKVYDIDGEAHWIDLVALDKRLTRASEKTEYDDF